MYPARNPLSQATAGRLPFVAPAKGELCQKIFWWCGNSRSLTGFGNPMRLMVLQLHISGQKLKYLATYFCPKLPGSTAADWLSRADLNWPLVSHRSTKDVVKHVAELDGPYLCQFCPIFVTYIHHSVLFIGSHPRILSGFNIPSFGVWCAFGV